VLQTLFSIADLHSSTIHKNHIVAFPWSCERATILRCTCAAYCVKTNERMTGCTCNVFSLLSL